MKNLKGNKVTVEDFVFITSEKGLIAEVLNVGNDTAYVEFVNRRPSGGDKRANYPLSELVVVEYDWDKNKYIKKLN